MSIESLYTLEEDACTSLRSKAGIRDFVVEREPQPVGNWVDQEDEDDEEDQSETSNKRRVRVKWEEGEHASIPLGERWGDVEP